MMSKAERRAYIEAQHYPINPNLSLAQFQKEPEPKRRPCGACGGTGDNRWDPRDVCDTCMGSGTL
jgi:hypothetical protein